jgi:uncharacterized membrane protein YfcA
MLPAYCVLIGLMAGVTTGFFGIGGGIVILPALVLLLGFEQHRAQGTSLLALVLPVGLLALIEYWRRQHVDVTAGLCLAAGMFAGAYIGSKFSLALDPVVLRRTFAVLMLLVAAQLWFTKP